MSRIKNGKLDSMFICSSDSESRELYASTNLKELGMKIQSATKTESKKSSEPMTLTILGAGVTIQIIETNGQALRIRIIQ